MTHPKAQIAIKNLGLDLNEYKNFLNELEISLRGLLKDANDELLKNDGKKAFEIIHNIKGNVGFLGFTASYQFCIVLENELKKGDRDNSIVFLKELIRIYSSELNEIKQTL